MAFSSSHFSFFLLISSFAVAVAVATQGPAPAPAPAHHHHHHPQPHPPTPPPSHPPVHPTPSPSHPPVLPTPPPTQPPVHPTPPPSHTPTPTPTPTPPRKYVAVQGVVYCKSCKYRGVDTLMSAAPLNGSVVKLQCNNTKQGVTEQTKTDKNGYFFFMPQKLTTSGVHKCKVFLVSSPSSICTVATDLHGGVSGALLTAPKKPHAESKPLPFVLYTVGPFAFEPPKDCHAAAVSGGN